MEEKKIEGAMRSWRRRRGRSRRRRRRKRRGKEGGSRVTFPSYQLPCMYLSSPAGLVISVKSVKLSKNPFERPQQLVLGSMKVLERGFSEPVKATSSDFHFVQINKLNSDLSDHTVFNVSWYLVLVDSIVRKDVTEWEFKMAFEMEDWLSFNCAG